MFWKKAYAELCSMVLSRLVNFHTWQRWAGKILEQTAASHVSTYGKHK